MIGLSELCKRAGRGDTPFALLYVDLDGFKSVNDIHGHDVGDKLVQGIADRLSHVLDVQTLLHELVEMNLQYCLRK